MRQLIYLLFITNDRTLLNLWLKENLVKHQKVPQCYFHDCSNKNNNFPSQFCLRSISNKFDCSDANEVFLKVNVHDFSVDYGAINKSSILDINKYLIIKNNI